MNYTWKHVQGHLEIYGEDGTFLFSADSVGEAQKTLEELFA